jgi:hypothetical protein
MGLSTMPSRNGPAAQAMTKRQPSKKCRRCFWMRRYLFLVNPNYLEKSMVFIDSIPWSKRSGGAKLSRGLIWKEQRQEG